MDAVAKEMTAAMKNNRGHTFVAGPAHKLNNYPADGTMFDYMAGVRHVPVSMAVELWGRGDQPGLVCFDLFNPQSRKLQVRHVPLLTFPEAGLHWVIPLPQQKCKFTNHELCVV